MRRTSLGRWRRWGSELASRLSVSRTDPQQRLLILVFGGLAVFMVVVGVSIAFLLQIRVEQRTENLAGALVASSIRGHLGQEVITGSLVTTAIVPSDTAWWRGFADHVLPMTEALGLDVLDADGTIVFSDGGVGAIGTRQIPPEQLRRLQAGQSVQYMRMSHANPGERVLVAATPVTFLTSDGSVAGIGAAELEIDASPVLSTSKDARNIALITTAAVITVFLTTLWVLMRRLTQRTFRDPLTDLPNRRYFSEAVAAILAHNARHQRPSALLFADINRLAEVNTSLGQRAGDAVLVSVARVLSKRVRAGDILARIGGDDFAVLLNEASVEQARLVADSIATALETATASDDQRMRISVSIGVSNFPRDGTTVNELLQHAESAMKAARQQQLPYSVFESLNPRMTSETLSLEADLRDALHRDELDVHFQPIVRASDSTIASYEALARWNHPAGPISPGTFIPIAENTGLIRHLDRYIYRRTVETIASIQSSQPDIRVSINLSAPSIADPTLPAYLNQVAEQHCVPSHRLTFEVTETAAIQNLHRATETLTTLRGLGFQVALDDFGTGYSSLAHLRKLPIDIVKIDRQFITGIGREPSDEMLVQSVIAYAHSLNLSTVAEGVETQEQHAWLRDKGIDYEQGYLHGKAAPLPVTAKA